MSVESVASRTRHRKKVVLDSVPELETIAEKEVKEEVKEEVKLKVEVKDEALDIQGTLPAAYVSFYPWSFLTPDQGPFI